MAARTLSPRRDAEKIAALLASPEIAGLVAELQATRWTGRPVYPIRTMVGMALVKSLYVLPTWTRTVALVPEHSALRCAIGGTRSADACYRFTRKLRQHKGMLDTCIAAVISSLHAEMPGLGTNIAIDGSDLPAYANSQRFLLNHGPERKKFSDAPWGHRSASQPARAAASTGGRHHDRPSALVDGCYGTRC